MRLPWRDEVKNDREAWANLTPDTHSVDEQRSNILSNTGLHLVVLGQKREVLVGTWRYWVSIRCY